MHVSMPLAFITSLYVLFCIMLHGEPVVSHPQGFFREGSLAQMLTVDASVDFEQHTLRSASVDTLDKWDGKSSYVKFTFD